MKADNEALERLFNECVYERSVIEQDNAVSAKALKESYQEILELNNKIHSLKREVHFDQSLVVMVLLLVYIKRTIFPRV